MRKKAQSIEIRRRNLKKVNSFPYFQKFLERHHPNVLDDHMLKVVNENVLLILIITLY